MKFIFKNLTAIIIDYIWYSDNIDKIDSWSEETFGYQPREGMVLTFQEESHKIWFILKWNYDNCSLP